MPHINYLAVLVGAVAIFILGALWYSPMVFAKRWIVLQGKSVDDMKGQSPSPAMFIQVFICGLLISWCLAIVIGFLPVLDVVRAIKLAVICWLGFAGATYYATTLFSMRPKELWLIDSLYNLVSFVVVAIILAVWR